MPGEYEAVLALVAGGQGNDEVPAVKVNLSLQTP